MSASSSKPPPPHLHLHLHVDNTSSATAATTNGLAASPGSASSSQSSRAPRPAPNGGGAGGGFNQACAACKYQRRRCSQDCPLAPYFPADQTRRFLNAHRLFGVSKIMKTLRQIEPKYAPDAMRSLIYQSEARAADPVGGCVSIIEELLRQMRHAETELQIVRQQIAICREAGEGAATGDLSDAAAAMLLPAASDHMAAVDAIYAGQQPSVPAGCSGPVFFHGQQQDYPVLKVEEHNDPSSHQQPLYDYFCYNNGGTAADGDEPTSDDGGMQQYYGFADSSTLNVKAQVLQAKIQHHEHKLATPVLVKHDDVDKHMEEEEEQEQEQQATAGAPCHLELGFSSS